MVRKEAKKKLIPIEFLPSRACRRGSGELMKLSSLPGVKAEILASTMKATLLRVSGQEIWVPDSFLEWRGSLERAKVIFISKKFYEEKF